MLLTDYLVTLGLDGFKGFISDKYNEHQMEEAIRAYVERQRDINFTCTREEEIDFGGVVEYLCSTLHDDIEQRLTGETSEIRGRAHRDIVAKAVSYAKAHTSIQEKRVKKMVNGALDILRNFYERKLSREQKYLAGRIADDVAQNTSRLLEEQTAVICQTIEQNAKPSPLSHDQVRRLAQEGRFDILGDALTDVTDTMSATHVLKPYYGFRPQTVNGKQQFVSVPLTEEARKLYPPHFKCNGRAYLGDREIGNVTPAIIDYANNHQLPIRLVVEDAYKCLGTHIDPQQCEVEEIIGEEYLLPPKPFPEAMAYSIIIDDVTYYEYILLRTKERFEDRTVVFTNEAQDLPFRITIRANPLTGNVNFIFAITGRSNSHHLKYARFLKAARSNGRLKVHHLERDKNLLEVNCSADESGEYMERLDGEIAFLENMIAIERYFGITIDLPEHFTSEDVELVHYVADIIQGKEIRNGWTKYEISMTIESRTKENITASMDEPYSLTYVGSATANIFGHNLTYPFMRTLLSVKLENPEKIIRLLEILDEGDDIKMVFIPGSDTVSGEYVDRLGDTTTGNLANEVI